MASRSLAIADRGHFGGRFWEPYRSRLTLYATTDPVTIRITRVHRPRVLLDVQMGVDLALVPWEAYCLVIVERVFSPSSNVSLFPSLPSWPLASIGPNRVMS